MKQAKKQTKQKKVVKIIRDSIVAAAREADVLQGGARGFVNSVNKKWQSSKPLHRSAVGSVKQAAVDIATFSKNVAQGVKEGVKQVGKMR